MRLRRLDLIRYGKFANASLDFGAGGRGTDVTVVYGDNEAGKSTAFAAWLDLLFGLPDRSPPYAYGMDRKDLLIGAVVETADGCLTLRRAGALKAPLTDDAGHKIADHRMTSLLHGLDRTAYRTRFSLDEAVLREGGEEIARAQGDLGQLLHAGTSGLSGMSEALADIGKEVDEFHKKGGRKTTLARARHALAELEASLAKARLDPRRFDSLRIAQAEAATESAACQDAFDAAQRGLHLHRAAEERRALTVEIQRLQERLGQLPDGPDLPEDAVARVTAAEEQLRAQTAAKTRAEEAQRSAHATLADLTPDAPGLKIAAKLETLEAEAFDDGRSLITRAQGAEADLADVRTQRDECAAQTRALAVRIGGEGCTPPDLILPRATRDRLQATAQRARDAENAVAHLGETQQEAAADLGPEIMPPTGLDPLTDALAACERDRSDPDACGAEAQEKRAAAIRTAAGLPGGWEALRDLPEDAALAALDAAADRAATAKATAQTQLAEAREEEAELQAERDALTESAQSVSDAHIADSRAGRDAAWAQHRDALDAATAQDFEAAMRHDDQLRDQHARSARVRLHLATLTQRLAQVAQRAARRQQTADDAETQAQVTMQKLSTAALALGLPADAPPSTLQPRRAALAAAQDAAIAAAAAEAKAQSAKTTRAALMGRLSSAIAGTGATPDPDRLIPQATRLRDRLMAQAQAYQAREAAARGLDKLTKRLSDAKAAQRQAQKAFATATADLWCAGQAPDTLLAQLRDIEELRELERRRADLDHRVQRMTAAVTAFLAATSDMRATLDLDDATPASDLLTAARQRAQAAKDRATQIARLKATVASAQTAITEAEREIARSRAEIDAVLTGQIRDPAQAPRQLATQLAQRDSDRAALRGLRDKHRQIGAVFDPDALAAEEAQTDPARADRLRDAADQAHRARDQALRREGEADAARRAALKGTGGAELDQERATLLEDLRESARMAAAQTLGLMAAHGALRSFRKDRRGAMLDATERAFSRLTHGEWPRLETQPMGKTERLVGLRDGQPVAADAMSTGTRGQLYLALRIAGHADFVHRHGPLPFVTDDIHETFDDRRATAALELTAEMGGLGQAILFTHHRHLVRLAQATVPGVRVIGL